MINENSNMAALYMRLSKEDDDFFSGESASIASQRQILLDFTSKSGFKVYDEYIDDGYSGTSFERPEFARMVRDIQCGLVKVVITKDLSRLGRNSARASDFLDEFLPLYGVRFISVAEGIDSEVKRSSKLAPITNVVNEWYAMDISDKIRDALEIRMKNGDYIGSFAPYGYKKSEENKNRLVIDEESAGVVKLMFSLARSGESPTQIAKFLNSQGVNTPLQYRYERFSGCVSPCKQECKWGSSTIAKLLRSTYYLGHTAQGKTKKLSYKNSRSIATKKQDWIIVCNTHDAIVDEDCFDTVQRLMKSRSCKGKNGFVNMFSGLVKCADCGRNMSSTGTRKQGSPACLCCGGYKLYGKEKCSNHHIDYNVLYNVVLTVIRQNSSFTDEDKQKLLKCIESSFQHSRVDNVLPALKERLNAVNSKLDRLYDDKYSSRIETQQFERLNNRYKYEQTALVEKMSNCECPVQSEHPTALELDRLLESIIAPQSLDSKLLFTLIERIEVCQGEYVDGVKNQKVRIYLKFKPP